MKAGVLFNPHALWIGAHYSTYNKRLCINVVPCVTVWICARDGIVPIEKKPSFKCLLLLGRAKIMAELKIKVPNVAHIVITGPTPCGKSIVMDRIEKALKDEFGANVVSEDLRIERNGNDYDDLAQWQTDMVKNTTWVLSEQ